MYNNTDTDHMFINASLDYTVYTRSKYHEDSCKTLPTHRDMYCSIVNINAALQYVAIFCVMYIYVVHVI